MILALPAACWAVSGNKHPSLCKIRYPSDSRIEWDCLRLKKGESVETRFGERWKDVLRFNRVDRRHVYPGVPLKVPRRLEDVADFTPMPAEYPGGDNEAKLILVDLEAQFLGAYEYGKRVFSAPVASGEVDNETPDGEFRITAYHSAHRSTEYFIEDTDIPYPMTWALRFHVDRNGVAYWIHGRDMPGYPASHGCVGLYDEAMQKKYYKVPRAPEMEEARKLFEWAIVPLADDGKFHLLKGGPVVRIVGGTREKKHRETLK